MGGSLLATPGIVAAQTASLLLPPATISGDDYDRGHNISVAERPHPEYDALGMRFGSFIVNPQLSTSLSYSSNVYNDNQNKKSDVYVGFEPYVTVASDWSVHQLRLVAAGDIRRFANQKLRNQNAWYVQTAGRVDVTSALNVGIEGQVDRTYESPFSLDVVANLIVPSRFFRTNIGTRIDYEMGQSRLIFSANRSSFNFDDIQFANGVSRNQQYRDRTNSLGSLTYEIGFNPSLSFYVRGEFDSNDYKPPVFGDPNRDSKGYRAIIGSNFDISGFARGTIGIGYSYRSFDAGLLYKNTKGFSIEARGDWFADELTTVGVFIQRRLIDVDIASAGSSWDNTARITVDHELLYNMTVSASGEVSKRTYPQLSSSTDVYRGEISAVYQVTRWLGLSADVGYGSTKPQGSGLGNAFDELRGRLSIRIRR